MYLVVELYSVKGRVGKFGFVARASRSPGHGGADDTVQSQSTVINTDYRLMKKCGLHNTLIDLVRGRRISAFSFNPKASDQFHSEPDMTRTHECFLVKRKLSPEFT